MYYSVSINYIICFTIHLILIGQKRNEARTNCHQNGMNKSTENAAWNQMDGNTLVQVGTEIFEILEKHYHILCELPLNSNMF